MDREELYEKLDIESGEDFQYFENFAELVETGDKIDEDALYELFSEMDMKTFAELAESFFYEMEDNVPEDQNDLLILTENIKRCLVGLAEAVRRYEEGALVKLCNEFDRFRRWYSDETLAAYDDPETGSSVESTVRDAITTARLERMGHGRYQYDFTRALDYIIDEYSMTYEDMADEEFKID